MNCTRILRNGETILERFEAWTESSWSSKHIPRDLIIYATILQERVPENIQHIQKAANTPCLNSKKFTRPGVIPMILKNTVYLWQRNWVSAIKTKSKPCYDRQNQNIYYGFVARESSRR